MPFEVGAIVGGVLDKNERLQLVRDLWHDPRKTVQSWVLAAALYMGPPPDDECRREEWRSFGRRKIYHLRALLTEEIIPCSTNGCSHTVKRLTGRDGHAFFANHDGRCGHCQIEASRAYDEKYGTYEDQRQHRHATNAKERDDLVLAIAELKRQTSLTEAGLVRVYEVMSGVGRFNYDLRKYREMGGVECGGCNVYDGIAPIVLAGTVLEEYT